MNSSNDLQEIIAHALTEMKIEKGDAFDPTHINLAELERRTGLSRSKLRTLKKNGFIVSPHRRCGSHSKKSVLDGYTGIIDNLLLHGVKNSQVCFERLREAGYKGGLTSIKVYIRKHLDLMPAKRQLVSPQGNRGRRYSTGPGETFQMDWGFTNVDAGSSSYRVACFAMICHHCGQRYVEFFPNAKQENLFIGMLHAFEYLGVPNTILTDNMKSVVNGRDEQGHPIFNVTYQSFMSTVGFSTKLCKPRHPFTKGAVERLVRFVKENFLAARTFGTITDLNCEALRWCNTQNGVYHKSVDCIPMEIHKEHCLRIVKPLLVTEELRMYLCPERRISFMKADASAFRPGTPSGLAEYVGNNSN